MSCTGAERLKPRPRAMTSLSLAPNLQGIQMAAIKFRSQTSVDSGFDGLCRNGNGVEWDSAVCHKGTVRPRGAPPHASGLARPRSRRPRRTGARWADRRSTSRSPRRPPALSTRSGFPPADRRCLARTRSGKSLPDRRFRNVDTRRSPRRNLRRSRAAAAARLPDAGARIVVAPGNPARIYALGTPTVPLRRRRTHLGKPDGVPLEPDRRDRASTASRFRPSTPITWWWPTTSACGVRSTADFRGTA